MATKVYSTPGVYIQEKDAFPSSVVAVPTAVPAFIGFTQKAMRGTKSLTNLPTRITSMAEYLEFFGGAPETKFEIKLPKAGGNNPAPAGGPKYQLEVDTKTRYNLFQAMRLFYSNGGGPCYIVSVGDYDYSSDIDAGKLNDEANMSGLPTLLKEHEPTLVVIPEAVLLKAKDCYDLQKQMVAHCQKMMNRFAILDVHQGYLPPGGNEKVISTFREKVNLGGKSMQWAAAYYPWLETTTVQDSEIDFTAISNLKELEKLLTAENAELLPKPTQQGVNDDNKERREAIDKEIKKLSTTTDDEGITVLSNTLLAVSPLFKDILKDISKAMNLMAPSSGIAGVYSKVDNDYGVQKAPANVGMMNVVKPAVNLTNVQQEDLNLPLNGLAVNAIRSFVGKGLLVWGARTLDGNSQDWRYINVRRSMIFLEQSIKNAAEAYVFEPNDANTWASIKSMIINFLTVQWRGGLLVGATQDDAFRVDVGLGVTMTPTDILDGVMNITVKVAISRPAEFIVITFQQQMQKS